MKIQPKQHEIIYIDITNQFNPFKLSLNTQTHSDLIQFIRDKLNELIRCRKLPQRYKFVEIKVTNDKRGKIDVMFSNCDNNLFDYVRFGMNENKT